MTNPNNYTTAYLYFATHTEEESDYDDFTGMNHAPCLYDYICDVDETPLDCESIEQLLMAYATDGEAA